jgi:Holliday junction resolvase RusA-like endonuclease
MPMPKDWSKRKKQLALNGEVKPSVKPDLDNLCKAVLDALNGIAYHDDKQIVELHLSKAYSDHPRTEIKLEEL